MKRIFKAMLFMGGSAAAGYFGFKVYGTIKAMANAEKALPGYLEGIYGEKPDVKCIVQMEKSKVVVMIRIKLSPEVLAKHSDIDEAVMDYIRDFHPKVAKWKIRIKLLEKVTDDDYEASGAQFTDPEEG